MRYHLVIEAPNGDMPAGPREDDALPEVGSTITETIEDKHLKLEVIAYEQVTAVPSGTFKHDEIWVRCRPV